MKTRKIISIGLIAIFFISCEDLLAPGNTKDIVLQLEGTWQCDEEDSILKSVMYEYQVYISPSDNDSTQVIISDFHHLGDDVEAVADVDGNSITLPSQTLLGGYVVRGSGTISSNLKEIAWKYYIDDGSGEEDEVNATYTFLY